MDRTVFRYEILGKVVLTFIFETDHGIMQFMDGFKSNQTFRFWQFLDFFNIIEGNSPLSQYGLMKFQYSVDECASGARVMPKYPKILINVLN